jgi:hypothetical protein
MFRYDCVKLTSMGLVLAPITATAKLQGRQANSAQRRLHLMTLAVTERLCVDVERLLADSRWLVFVLLCMSDVRWNRWQQ